MSKSNQLQTLCCIDCLALLIFFSDVSFGPIVYPELACYRLKLLRQFRKLSDSAGYFLR